MTPLQTIREACIKANPEIVELKFGCEFREPAHQEKENFLIHRDLGNTFLGGYVTWNVHFEYRKDFAKQNFEIIGRPIRLSDVLLAWAKADKEYETELMYLSTLRDLIHIWNKRDDNLEHQSEECLQFLANLLKP